MRFIFFLFFSFSFLGSNLIAQENYSKDQLQLEKQRNLENLKKAKAILNKTKKEKSISISQLRTLNKQIVSQTKQIQLIGNEIGNIDKDITGIEATKKELDNRLEKLKKEYSEALYQAAKKNNTINQFSFLFSAQNFNDFIMRYRYLEQYTLNRKAQRDEIEELQNSISLKQEELLQTRGKKSEIVKVKNKEAQELYQLKDKQAIVVNELSKEEKKISAQVASYQRSVKQLDNRINNLIRKEIEKRRLEEERLRAANRPATTDNESANRVLPSTPKAVVRGSSFGSNRNKLPWPVRNGLVTEQFGVRPHPVLKKVQVDNNGISIQTLENGQVTSVFDGVVMDVSQIPGMHNVVAIQHGDYYTVYANLQAVGVSINQQVAIGQYLGTAANNNDGVPEINFQIWHNFSKLNPELWLSRK